MLFLFLYVAVSATPPEAAGGSALAPAARVARQDGERPVRDAIRLLRESKSYGYTFESKSESPGSSDLVRRGRGVMADGGVLSTVIDGDPGKIHHVIVATEKVAYVWYEHLPEPAWMNSSAVGEPDAGRGLENPNELLKAVEGELSAARVNGDGSVSLRLEGEPVRRVAESLGVDVDRAQWNQSRVTLTFRVNAATGRIDSVRSEGHVQFGAGAPVPAADFTASVTIVDVGGARLISDARDSEGKPVPMADALSALKLDPAKFK